MLTMTTVNGIHALWTDGPAPYSVALVFGSGAMDETVRTKGVAHLVEHLIMAAQERTALDINAMVDEDTMVFHASGERQAVTEWFVGVCAAIRDLPLDRMETEVKVLDAEQGGAGAASAIGWAAGARFGYTGVGVLGGIGVPHRTLTRDHVMDFARRHLTVDNAVLVATGEPPEHPGITLPTGPRPHREPAVDHAPELPAYLCGPPVAIVTWVCERTPAAAVLRELVVDLLTDELRHRQGLVYEVESETVAVSSQMGLVALWAEAGSNEAVVLARAWNILGQIASHGPDAADLDHQKAVARNRMGDPRAALEFLVHAAHRYLEGRPLTGIDEAIAQIESVTAEQVRRVAAAALLTLLLGGSIPRTVGIVGIPDRTEAPVPDCPAFEGLRWKRKLVSLAPRDLRLDINEDGLAQTSLGDRRGGLWSDVVGVAKGKDFRDVGFRDGGHIRVWRRDLKDGEGAVAEIDRRAADLLFEVGEDWL